VPRGSPCITSPHLWFSAFMRFSSPVSRDLAVRHDSPSAFEVPKIPCSMRIPYKAPRIRIRLISPVDLISDANDTSSGVTSPPSSHNPSCGLGSVTTKFLYLQVLPSSTRRSDWQPQAVSTKENGRTSRRFPKSAALDSILRRRPFHVRNDKHVNGFLPGFDAQAVFLYRFGEGRRRLG
jgi:hypothetical protein